MNRNFAIVVLSHLRWDFVFQRPQQLLSRLAGSHQVFFVEEPVGDRPGAPEWEFREAQPNVLICTPHTPSPAPGFHDEQMPYLKPLLSQLIESRGISDFVLWFYTPMAFPAAADLPASAVVYDCMDELSAFWGAAPELKLREDDLLARASLVFTGGPSLFRAKQNRHPSVHCFPSSVDSAHFANAAAAPEPADQAALPRPRVGFFGVLDERLDLGLLDALAAGRPDWQIVMVGPVVKIDPQTLPQHPNLHYLGQRSYADLPAYLGGWDVCLLPFARNRSTEFISPTKTLEYMAAGKMIVSTPITDVAEPYGKIVYLGGTHEEFIAACDRALQASPSELAARRELMREVLQRTSWDSTVARMEELVSSAVAAHSGTPGIAPGSAPKSAPTVIVGAGPTGLSAAYHAGADSILIEQNSRIGGWCRSVEVNGFTFDYAGHIMFSGDPYVHQLYKMLLGDNVHWQDREAWIYSKSVYTRYPFQGSLYGLPADVIRECIMGAIEARFGALKAPKDVKHTNGHSAPNGSCNGVKDCCADGILEASAPLVEPPAPAAGASAPRNFEEFIYKVWGAGIARHFAIPYNRKLWSVPLDEMETSWLGGRVPLPDLEEMIQGALSPTAKPMGPNARFGYPLRGGFQALMDGWMGHLKGELRLNTRVAAVSPSRRTVTLSDGSELRYEHLISTMPLPVLIRQMGSEAPVEIQAAAARLRHVSVRCVHLGVGRERLTDKHWIYYPEDTVFHRIFVQGNASPHCNPPGGFGLTCEITYSPYKPLPCDGDDLVRLCIEDCKRVGLLRPDDPIWASAQCDLPMAYVVYDHARAEAVELIRGWLAENGITLAGRYSEWEYYNSDHAFLAGKRAVEKLRESEAPLPALWSGPGSSVATPVIQSTQ